MRPAGARPAEVARDLAEVAPRGTSPPCACRDLDPRRAHRRDPAGVHRHAAIRREHADAAGAAAAAQAAPWATGPRSPRRGARGGRTVPRLLLPGQRRLRPPALRHRVRGTRNRFRGQRAHDYPADFRHDFIMRVPNRCIDCLRCVEVCRIEVGASCYDVMGRGWDDDRLDARQPAVADGRLHLVRQVCQACRPAPSRPTTHPAELRVRRKPLHLLWRVRRGLPLRRARADRLLRACRLQSHEARWRRRSSCAHKPAPDALRRCRRPGRRARVEGDGWQWSPVKGDGGLEGAAQGRRRPRRRRARRL